MTEKLTLLDNCAVRAPVGCRISRSALMESQRPSWLFGRHPAADQRSAGVTATGLRDTAITSIAGTRAEAAHAGATFIS